MSAGPNYRQGGREGRPARKDDWRTPPELYDRLNAEHDTKRRGGGLTTPSALVVYRPAGGPPRYAYVPAVQR